MQTRNAQAVASAFEKDAWVGGALADLRAVNPSAQAAAVDALILRLGAVARSAVDRLASIRYVQPDTIAEVLEAQVSSHGAVTPGRGAASAGASLCTSIGAIFMVLVGKLERVDKVSIIAAQARTVFRRSAQYDGRRTQPERGRAGPLTAGTPTYISYYLSICTRHSPPHHRALRSTHAPPHSPFPALPVSRSA